MVLWRACEADDAVIRGIGYLRSSPFATSRDPKHWGSDASQFKPERWLDRPIGGANHLHTFLSFPFDSKPCLDKAYAWADFRAIVGFTVGRLQFSSLDSVIANFRTRDGTDVDFGLVRFAMKRLSVFGKERNAIYSFLCFLFRHWRPNSIPSSSSLLTDERYAGST